MGKRSWFRRQKKSNKVCRYCGTNKGLSIDHIQPKSRGGTDNEYNLQVLCRFCNQNKSNLTDYEIASIFRDIKSRGVWYKHETTYERWLSYIEIKRTEYKQPPLDFGDKLQK